MHTARRALDGFEDVARRRGVSHETRLVSDQAPDALALLARFADLVVVSQDDPDESLGYLPPAMRMPDYVVVNAARPVLVVPRRGAPPACPRRVLLCWNGSREAAVAMAGAVPLLQQAAQVSLAVLTTVSPKGAANPAELNNVLAFLGRLRYAPRRHCATPAATPAAPSSIWRPSWTATWSSWAASATRGSWNSCSAVRAGPYCRRRPCPC
jgi:hypothetical protein